MIALVLPGILLGYIYTNLLGSKGIYPRFPRVRDTTKAEKISKKQQKNAEPKTERDGWLDGEKGVLCRK